MFAEMKLERSSTPHPPYASNASNASTLVGEEEKSEKSEPLGPVPSLKGLEDIEKGALEQSVPTVPSDSFARLALLKKATSDTAQSTAKALALPKKAIIKQPKIVTPEPFEVANDLEAGLGSMLETQTKDVHIEAYSARMRKICTICLGGGVALPIATMIIDPIVYAKDLISDDAFVGVLFGGMFGCFLGGVGLGVTTSVVMNRRLNAMKQANE